MRVFSYGGGVQSTAALVLAAQKKIDFPVFLFSNVGDDSENPDTLMFVENYAKSFAEDNGIEIIELKRTWKDGRQTTLLEYTEGENRTIPIPAYFKGGKGNRNCTVNWKRDVISKWMKKSGATAQNPGICGLGISWDEIKRMRDSSGIAWQIIEYPLIDLRLTREDCQQIITASGLPLPGKSSCWFCPFHRVKEWEDLKRDKPRLFKRAIELEDRINEKRREFGRDEAFLHTRRKPLEEAVGDLEVVIEEDECDSGHCFV